MSTTPIAKIPTEILGEIFYFLCPGPVTIPSVGFYTLWSAAEVCSRWRGVALGLCRLWNNLEITFRGDLRSDRAMIYYIEQSLLRSQVAPLSIQVTAEAPYILSRLSFLIPHSTRIRHLSINTNGEVGFTAFPNLVSLDMKVFPHHYKFIEWTPVLEELRIENKLPLMVMQRISEGKFWPSLRLIECNLYASFMDRFIDMIESRVGGDTGTTAKCISDVVARCQDFRVTDGQWGRVRALQDRGIRIILEEQDVDAH